MAIDRHEVELLVRANLQGKGDIEAVTKSIGKLESAIESQAAAAKKGEGSIDELKASLADLAQVQDRLKGNADLIGRFQTLGETIARTETRVSRTAKAYEDYETKLKAAGDVTDKQQERLIKLALASERAQTALGKQNDRQQQMASTLREAGIATDALAGAENRVREAAVQIAVAMNKAQGAIGSYTEDLRKAKAAEKALAEENVFQQKLRDAQQLGKSINYVNWWGDALERADAAQAKLAADASLAKAGDEAVAAARKYNTLANAATDLNPKVTTLRDTLRGIVDPAAQVRSTLSGVEGEVKALAASIGNINGPVSDYREQMSQLAAAQKALGQQGGLVDAFRQQMTQVKAARAEFVAARAQMLEYAQGIRDGSVSTDKLAAAQARLSASAKGLSAQVQAARAARSALQAAGISASTLVAAEERIVTSSRAATAAMQALTVAARDNGAATEGAAKKLSLFDSGGRTTLSLMQRLRGEVLSLTASYVGLQAAVGLAGSSGQAAGTMQGIRNQLALSVGTDAADISAELEYLRGQADRIGISFEGAAKSFAKYSAAATLAGRSSQEIHFVFETFAEVGRVANLTEDDMNGVFKALEQITSKGKIQAEELRGQLGDRLFGAFQVAAIALKDQFPDLDKAMKDGVVTSEQLVAIAAKYREIVADQLPAATRGLAAEQDRFKSGVFEFKNAIADSGWAESYATMLRTLTEFMRSEDGQVFAEAMAKSFSAVADSLTFLIEHADEATTALAILVELFGAFKVVQGALALKEIYKGFKDITGAISGAGKAFGILGAIVLAWEIGKYLYDKFEIVRVVFANFVTGLEVTWAYIKFGWNALWEDFPGVVKTNIAKILNAINPLRQLFGQLANLADFAGFGKLSKTFESLSKGLTITPKLDISKARAQLQKDIGQAVQNRTFRIQNATTLYGLNVNGKSRPSGAPTAQPDMPKGRTAASNTAAADKAAATALAQREQTAERLDTIIENLRAKINKAQDETLAAQLRAFDFEMANEGRKFKAFGDPARTAAFEKAKGEMRMQITSDFNKKLLADEEALQARVESLDAASGRKQKTSIEERRKAVVAANADLFRDLDAMEARLTSNGRDTSNVKGMREQAQAAVALRQDQEEMAAREAQINALLETRGAIITRIDAQRKAGLITLTEANNQTRDAIVSIQPEIDKLTVSSLAWADAMKGALTPEQLELFRAKILEMQTSGGAMQKQWSLTADSAAAIAAPKISAGIENIADGFARAVVGAQSFGDAVKNMGQVFMQFVADFLREIAMMIIKQAIFNALAGMGGGLGAIGAAGGGVAAPVAHSGGIVGHTANRTRNVSSAWFGNAPRYHTGGVVGLSPDEYPAILQRNEEVLSAGDPRNILNGGGQGGGSAQPSSARFVLVDDRAKVAEAMRGSDGEQVTLLHLRRNIPSLKQMLK